MRLGSNLLRFCVLSHNNQFGEFTVLLLSVLWIMWGTVSRRARVKREGPCAVGLTRSVLLASLTHAADESCCLAWGKSVWSWRAKPKHGGGEDRPRDPIVNCAPIVKCCLHNTKQGRSTTTSTESTDTKGVGGDDAKSTSCAINCRTNRRPAALFYCQKSGQPLQRPQQPYVSAESLHHISTLQHHGMDAAQVGVELPAHDSVGQVPLPYVHRRGIPLRQLLLVLRDQHGQH